jgi:cell division transport system permease protein
MRISLIKYFFKRAFSSFKASILLNTLTVISIIFSMFILSLFMLFYVNLDDFLKVKGGNIEVSAYIRDSVGEAEAKKILAKIISMEGISKAEFISKEDARKAFLQWNKKFSPVVQRLGENPFPSSIEINLSADIRAPERVAAIAEKLSQLEGVESVDYSAEWVAKLLSFSRALRLLGIFILVFLLLATVLLVSNTIRLNLYSRRDEIGIMSIVGATGLFIKIPFLIEGILQGLLGSLGALFILFAVYRIFSPVAGEALGFILGGYGIVFLPVKQMTYVVALGTAIGLLGSNLAVRKFLRGEA